MSRHRPILIRMIGVMLIVVVPAVLLYTYFSRVSIDTIDAQITASNENRLGFLRSQIVSNVDRLAMASSVLSRDSSVLNLQISILTGDYYGTRTYQTQLKEKLSLQSLSSPWSNELSVSLPEIERRISTLPTDPFNALELDAADNGVWRLLTDGSGRGRYYQMFMWDPFGSKRDTPQVNAVYEVRFGLENIRKMLREFRQEGDGQTFLLASGGAAFGGVEGQDEQARALGAELLQGELGDSGHRSLHVEGQQAYLSHLYVPSLDAYLIDYVPLSVIHAPIVESRNLFYLGLLAVLLLGMAATYLLYLHVQKPISAIVQGLKQFEIGDYTYRIHQRFHNEFDYMMRRFNDMGNQIEHLIRNVYEEQNRSRLATLKQLQSQIHPHFLYNCFSFIAACAKGGYTDTIRQMAFHLGDYYRYTTRVENQTPPLREEAELVRHYLAIYKLRLERLAYEVELPEEMLEEPMPRLILQPVVENAIEHGVEPLPGSGRVRVSGSIEGPWRMVTVEDSGSGMSEAEIEAYMQRLELPMDETIGCGLWNVNERLRQRFGAGAGISLTASQRLSGLAVTLRWRIVDTEQEGKDTHD
ncbi:histidine kinase [Paenibacillus sp. IB182496]|uniref:Histidine kinase n=1 Tax=Paenibacillus sabuli TaxID=2772509 RepID=A0A927GTD6_9BACL|nr:histidine kinase [Paenibacillus sabuli]MBD2846990.1 histidine kinase [Paenibacillus sabuli]